MERWHHIKVACGLLVLSGAIQGWCLRAAVLPALDAVRYVAEAQRIEKEGAWAAVGGDVKRPLFPLMVAATKRGLQEAGYERADIWALAAQVAAAVPLVISVVPVYLAAVVLVDGRAAAVGGAIYSVLPEVARLGADGIGDSTHLLWFALATMAIVVALSERENRRGWLAAAWMAGGMLTGLAVFCRVESVVLIPAMLLAVVANVWAEGRRCLSGAAVGAAWFGAGLLVVVGALWLVSTAPRGIAMRISSMSVEQPSRGGEQASAGRVEMARDLSEFAPKESSVSSRSFGYLAACRELASELPQVYHYWIGALVLWGGWLSRHDRRRAVDRFVQAFVVLYFVSLVVYAARAGYLSGRHLVPLVAVTIGWAGVGTLGVAKGLTAAWGAGREGWERGWLGTARKWGAAVVVVGVGVSCLPRTLAPLHASRAGHCQAAAWLARNARPEERVLDTRGWTGLYSGRSTYRYDAAREAFGDGALRFVVVERHELNYESPRSRRLAALLDVAGTEVVSFGGGSERGADAVVVFRWDAQRYARRVVGDTLTN